MNTLKKKRIFTAMLAFAMLISTLSVTVFAVTGNQIAADGNYTSKLQGYKEGSPKSGYTATLNITVSGGYITTISMTNSTESKMIKAFNASGYQNFLNREASVDIVDEVSSSDAISSATTSATPSTKTKYSLNLVDALKAALATAPNSGNTSSEGGAGGQVVSDEVLTAPLIGYKSGSIKYSAILNVGIKDDKIQNMWLTESTSSKMGTSLQALYTAYLGKDATVSSVESVDAVSTVSVKPTASDSGYSINLVDSLKLALSGGTDYTAPTNGQKYKKGKATKYSAVLNARIKNGKIIGVWLTDAGNDAMNVNIFYQTGYASIIGIDATESSVNAVASTSAVTGAAAKASITNSYEYSMNLTEALLNAISQYVQDNIPDKTLIGSASVDNDKYQLDLIVGVKDDKIIFIKVGEGTTGDWSNILSVAANLLCGKNTSDAGSMSADAVSSATKYSAAFYQTIADTLDFPIDNNLEIKSVEQDEGVFNVTLSQCAEEGVIVIAAYCNDGRLNKVELHECDGKSSYPIQFTVDDNDSQMCVFVWKNMVDIIPLCPCKSIPLAK